MTAVSALVLPLLAAGPSAAQGPERDTDPAPPCTAGVPAAPFADRAAVPPVHRDAVDCLAFYGITLGSGADGSVFAPGGQVSRAAGASFLARTVVVGGTSLPDPSDTFTDVAGSVHADAIRRLASAGVVQGRAPGRYDPDLPVSRGQAASLLLRGAAFARGVDVETLLRDTSPFTDTRGSVHARTIAGARELGLVSGTSATTYAPDQAITRAQMAAVLARWLSSEAPTTTACTSTTDVYSLRFPAAWAQNGPGRPACTVFDPQPFDDPADGELPLLAVVLSSPSGTFAQWLDPVEGQAVEASVTLTVDGRQAVRQRVLVTDDPPFEGPRAGTRYTRWVVDRGGSVLIGTTFAAPLTDPRAAVLDRVMLSLDLTGSGLPPFLPPSTVSVLPSTAADLDLRAVRMSDRGAYDRLVLEFSGAGPVGWTVAEWRAEPRFGGSGAPVVIAGTETLAVAVPGQVVPPAPPFAGPERVPGPGDPLREVVTSGVFEGQVEAFLGTGARHPFRVLRLADPERVVVDVLGP